MANKELELKQEKVRLEETIQTVKALIQGVDSLEESQRKEAHAVRGRRDPGNHVYVCQLCGFHSHGAG